MLDFIIKNGKIIDGTGNCWIQTDLGIKDGKIKDIGDLSKECAKRTINAIGKVVCPGFIDIHTHSDFTVTSNLKQDSAVHQGVTTEVIGNCGFSPYPVIEQKSDLIKDYIGGLSPGEGVKYVNEGFFDYLYENGHSANLAPLIGHSVLKLSVMGFENRKPTNLEMQAMKSLLKEYLDYGVLGFSNCLVFAPGIYTQKEELIELCRLVSKHGGFCATHIRSESDDIENALKEAIEIGGAANIPIHVSHHKAACKANWGKTKNTLKMMEEARAQGVDITCDVYPYLSAFNMIRVLLPNWLFEGEGVGGMVKKLNNEEIRQRVRKEMAENRSSVQHAVGWDKVTVLSVYTEANKKYEGMNFAEIGEDRGVEPCDALMDMMIEEQGQGLMAEEMMCDEDLERILRYPYSSIGSDSGSEERERNLNCGKVHPRTYGAFARILGKYVRELGVLRLEDAIRKMTSLSAQRLGLKDRGLLMCGYAADIVIFDPDTVIDKATYKDSRQFPLGIEYVFVNGEIVIEKGCHTGKMPGKILLKQ